MQFTRIFITGIFWTALLCSAVFGQDNDVIVLRDGMVIHGELKGGEHFLRVVLEQGQFLQLDIQEHNLDLKVMLIRLGDKQPAKLSNFGAGYDRETLSYIAEQTGLYVLIVGTRAEPSNGRYVLKTLIKAEVTARERERVAAEQLLDEGLGRSKGKSTNLKEAVVTLQHSLALWKRLGEPYWEGYTLYHLGRLHGELKEQSYALDYYNKALPVMRQVGDVHGEAAVLNEIGLLYSNLGEKAKTLEYYTRALALSEKTEDFNGHAAGLHNLGAVYYDIDENQKALDYYHQALSRFKQLNNRSGEANALLGLGEVYSDLGAKVKAIEHFKQAGLIFTDANDMQGAATALHDIGSTYLDIGDRTKSLEYCSKALEVFHQLGNAKEVANALKSIGWVYSASGEKARALEYFNRALSLLKEVGDLRVEASMLNAIGRFYMDAGEWATALNYFKEALPRFKQAKEQKEEAETLLLIGMTYSKLSRKEEAVGYFLQALPIYRKAGNKRRDAEASLFIADMYFNSGERTKAFDYFKEPLILLERVAAEGGSSGDLNNVGSIYYRLGENRKALDYLNRALASSKEDDVNAEYVTLYTLSLLWEKVGNRRMAVLYGKLTVNRNQERRRNLQGIDNEVQKSFLRFNQGMYQHLAELLIEEGQIEQAIHVLTLYQDQDFFDFNRDTALPVRKVDLSPREQKFAANYEAAIRKVWQIDPRVEELKQELAAGQQDTQEVARMKAVEAERQLAVDAVLDFLKSAEREFAGRPDEQDNPPVVRHVADMRLALRDLGAATGQKTTALYTLIGREKLYVIVLTPEGEVKPFASPIKQDVLTKKILEFYALLQLPAYDPRPLGEDLYKLIFEPVEATLQASGVQNLMWQLDGHLRYVPVAALFDGEKYLVERYQNVILTRSDTRRVLQGVKPSWTGAGFGTTREYVIDLLGDGRKISFHALPGVAWELQSIFRTTTRGPGSISGEIFMDSQFTKSAFYDVLKRRRPLVHISSHFAFRPGDDSGSFLLLGDGTALTLSELKKQEHLFEGVELLTLSACDTAAARADANGREIDGFAELAQRLGAHAVMATLWQVSDTSTPWLMREFYTTRQGGGSTKAAALRNAQLALLNGTAEAKSLPVAMKAERRTNFNWEIFSKGTGRPRTTARADIIYIEAANAPPFKQDEKKPFAHPYFWAPFVLYGNGR